MIEASKIAGHSDLEMTSEYTFVAPERQNEQATGSHRANPTLEPS